MLTTNPNATLHENTSIKVLEVSTSPFFTALLEHVFSVPMDCRTVDPAITSVKVCPPILVIATTDDPFHNGTCSLRDLSRNAWGIAGVAGLDPDERDYFFHLMPGM